jgi:hypothetical protein
VSDFDMTPQGLKATETLMRKELEQRLTPLRLGKFMDDAKRQLQTKQELVCALSEMLIVMDAARFAGTGDIAFDCNFSAATFVKGGAARGDENYRTLLAKTRAEVEHLRNVVGVYEVLQQKQGGNYAHA